MSFDQRMVTFGHSYNQDTKYLSTNAPSLLGPLMDILISPSLSLKTIRPLSVIFVLPFLGFHVSGLMQYGAPGV